MRVGKQRSKYDSCTTLLLGAAVLTLGSEVIKEASCCPADETGERRRWQPRGHDRLYAVCVPGISKVRSRAPSLPIQLAEGDQLGQLLAALHVSAICFTLVTLKTGSSFTLDSLPWTVVSTLLTPGLPVTATSCPT